MPTAAIAAIRVAPLPGSPRVAVSSLRKPRMRRRRADQDQELGERQRVPWGGGDARRKSARSGSGAAGRSSCVRGGPSRRAGWPACAADFVEASGLRELGAALAALAGLLAPRALLFLALGRPGSAPAARRRGGACGSGCGPSEFDPTSYLCWDRCPATISCSRPCEAAVGRRRRRRSMPPSGGGDPGNGLAGPFPVGEYAAALRGRLRAFARVQLVGELVNLRFSRARVYFELRDSAGAIACAVWRADWETLLGAGGSDGGGRAGRGRRRLRLLPRQRERLAELLLRRQRPAGRRRGRSAGADRPPAQDARRRGAAGAPAAPGATAAAAHDRRGHGRGRQGPRRHARGARAARLGGPPGLGLRTGAGSPRGAGDHARAAATSRRSAGWRS